MRRALPIVTFLMATLLAGGSAWAINLLLGRWISPGELPEDHAAVASARATPRTPRPRALGIDNYLQGIMGRNLFDKEVIATWQPQTATEGGPVIAKSELHVKLVLVFVAVPSSLSSALILDEDSKDYPKAYSIGDKLYDRTVKSIEKEQVALEKPNGEIEYLTLGTAVVARHDEGPAAATDEGDGSVSQTGENRFTVSKDTFEKNINDLESISKMGRALLHRGPDGEYDGYRLSAIRRGTLADQLGIKNGDIIHSVNGESLNSMQAAMNAYNTMKTQSSFCFEISRRGTPTELCYDVR
ncbi:MAG: hypothetical protein H6735_12525 [Alphaproteobacteria bacterium]|nr:hypothetical protein [Alphaproteobacteria bacterium]